MQQALWVVNLVVEDLELMHVVIVVVVVVAVVVVRRMPLYMRIIVDNAMPVIVDHVARCLLWLVVDRGSVAVKRQGRSRARVVWGWGQRETEGGAPI